MNIALRKRTLSPVRHILEESSKRSFMLSVVVSLKFGGNDLILTDLTTRKINAISLLIILV